jgi:hypothetical protein
VAGGAPALGRAAGVEDLQPAGVALVEGEVGVPEHDGVGPREAPSQPRQAPARRAGVVDHHDAGARGAQRAHLGEQPAKLEAVDVAVDRRHGRVRLEFAKDLDRAQVAGVDDQVGRLEALQAGARQPAGTALHVGVGHYRQQHGRRAR